MKRLSILFLVAFSVVAAAKKPTYADIRDSGRKKPIDNCVLAVTYRVRISQDTIGKEFYFDNQILEVGAKLSHYYSVFSENIDSVMYKARQEPSGGIDVGVATRKNMGKDEDGNYEDIFINYPSAGLLTVINRIAKNDYAYAEPCAAIGWQIIPATTQVLGYNCQKATCTFRGRQWTAWFTTQIPVPMGPYKFGGLPGLILKIEDASKLFIYEAIGVEQPKNRAIYKYDIPTVKSSRKDVAKLLEMRWKDPKTLALANGVKSLKYMTFDENGKLIETEDQSGLGSPYIPTIELE